MPNEMVNFNVPTPYQADMASIAQRQRMAELLSQQSQAPGEQFSYNGIMAKPSKAAGANKVLQAVLGAWGQKNALSEQRALGEKAKTEAMDWMSQVAAPGTPAQPAIQGQAAATPLDTEEAFNANQQPVAPGQMQATAPGQGDPGSQGAPAMPAQPRSRQAQLALLMQGMGIPYAAGVAQSQIAKMLAPPEFKAVGENDRPGTVDPATGTWTPTPGGAPANPYRGTGEGAQDYNILLQGDPSSPVYAAAYNRQAAPKTFQDPVTGEIIRRDPDMSAFRRPGTAGAPGSDMGPPGSTTAVESPATGPTKTDVVKLKEFNVGLSGIESALTRYEQAINNATQGDFIDAVSGGRTKGGAELRAAWTNFALFAKDESLYKLGVLAGPDLSLIEKSIPDPSSISGAARSRDSHLVGIGQIREILNNRRSMANEQYGGKAKAGGGPAPSETLPPEAIAQLKEGIHTEFGNGQVWMKSNGKPVRVK